MTSNANGSYNLIRALRSLVAAKEYFELYKSDDSGVTNNSKYQVSVYQERLDWIINDAAQKQKPEQEKLLRDEIKGIVGLHHKIHLLPMAKQIELENIVNYMLTPEPTETPALINDTPAQ